MQKKIRAINPYHSARRDKPRLLRSEPICMEAALQMSLMEMEKRTMIDKDNDHMLEHHHIKQGETYIHNLLGEVKVLFSYWNPYIQKAVAIIDDGGKVIQPVIVSSLSLPIPPVVQDIVDCINDTSDKDNPCRRAYIFIIKEGKIQRYLSEHFGIQGVALEQAAIFIKKKVRGYHDVEEDMVEPANSPSKD